MFRVSLEFAAFTADLYRLADWLSECGVETVVIESTGVYWIPLFGVLEEHIFELTQALELYRVYQAKIAECDREIEAQLERFEDVSDGGSPDGNGRRRSQGNAPSFDIRTHLYRMTGVDLTRIDGVDGFTALKVSSEIGTDMTKWPTAKHFASWLGLSPDNRITGGKVKSSKTKPSANRAAAALRMAANALHRSDRALGAFLRRKKAHLGAPKAITATAHKLARLIYSMLRYGRTTWMLAPNTTRASISTVRCARLNGGRPNSATNWCPCPMLSTMIRVCPSTHQRPSPENRVSQEPN